jgi:hypothetical protein
MNKIVSILLVLFTIVMASSVAFAQAPPPSSNPPGAPIDGMVALLLTAGVGYGVYRSKKEAA